MRVGEQNFWSVSFKAALPKQECPGEGTMPCKCWDEAPGRQPVLGDGK